MSKIQLGVMFGSRSCEHEVSIISAVQLMRAADRQLYDVIPIYISKRVSGSPATRCLRSPRIRPLTKAARA